MSYDPYDPFGIIEAMDSLGGTPGGPSLKSEAAFVMRQWKAKERKKALRKEVMAKGPKYFILDFRASEEDGLDDALVLDTAETLEEARQAAKAQNGGVIYENSGEMIEFSHMVEIVESKDA